MTESQSVARIVVGDRPAEVGRVRRELRDSLTAWGADEDSLDTALLLSSELVTNAILHGSGPVTLSADYCAPPGCLRVVVHDGSPVAVAPRSAQDADTGGRGLLLVDVLASQWGCGAEASGKNVWFELAVAV